MKTKTTSSNIEKTDQEIVEEFLKLHASDNRHLRRRLGKFIKIKIPGSNIPWQK